MDQVEKLGIGGHTYLIYMSDNGAVGGGLGVLRGSKGSLWEGGIRVPLIIQGPGIEPNTFCDERVVGFDLFPTLCEADKWTRGTYLSPDLLFIAQNVLFSTFITG